MVGTSRKDSTKDEVRTSTLGYVQALRKAGHEPRQGSAMSAWGAPSPRSRPAGVEVSLDKADAVIEGLRFFLRFGGVRPAQIREGLGAPLEEEDSLMRTDFRPVPLEGKEHET